MKTGFIFTLLMLLSGSLFAQNSGLEMLNIAPTPYSLSRAEATVSLPEGAASIFSNPALLVYNDASSLDLGYSLWIANVNNAFGGVNFKNDKRAIAFSFYSSGSNNYEQRDGPSPDPNGTFSIQYLSIAAAYAYDFNYFSLGGAFQFLNEENYTYRASGYAFNLGVATHFMNERVRAGASISNLGEMERLIVEATTLPVNAKVGFAADIAEISAQKNNELPILISASTDFVYPLSDTNDRDYADYTASDPHFNVGMFFTIAEVVEVSGGYKFRTKDIFDGDFSGYTERPFSLGAGFITDNIRFNYALIPFKTGWGTVHSIGIQYQF